jgi:hypothetical protein
MHARCVVYGVGYYAAFAAKIGGIDCSYLYAEEAWGSHLGSTTKHRAKICPNKNSNDDNATTTTAARQRG